VPQVFIANQSLGGYDDIAALNASGELDRLLQAHLLTNRQDNS
jgi:glutaredoxin-related protein